MTVALCSSIFFVFAAARGFLFGAAALADAQENQSAGYVGENEQHGVDVDEIALEPVEVARAEPQMVDVAVLQQVLHPEDGPLHRRFGLVAEQRRRFFRCVGIPAKKNSSRHSSARKFCHGRLTAVFPVALEEFRRATAR